MFGFKNFIATEKKFTAIHEKRCKSCGNEKTIISKCVYVCMFALYYIVVRTVHDSIKVLLKVFPNIVCLCKDHYCCFWASLTLSLSWASTGDLPSTLYSIMHSQLFVIMTGAIMFYSIHCTLLNIRLYMVRNDFNSSPGRLPVCWSVCSDSSTNNAAFS